ncbi:hypothetical protein ATB98_04865 [Sinorhizobium saheli]|uniref:Solute-binding protein family 5 domain-containing protein n=1 Tax=Sinorhizobium saheli TaxID=36856 RepID=A0A178XWZ0_SINSA|nr:hypothetical protein ATB98_04865 [Sinorhizobium saheli]
MLTARDNGITRFAAAFLTVSIPLVPTVEAQEQPVQHYGSSLSFPDDISLATFRLRQEAKWADGEAVTSEDVVFSFKKGRT